MNRLLTVLRRTAQPLSGWVSVHDTSLRTGSTTILLPFTATVAGSGDRVIDWGDGTVEVDNTANPTHTYATGGVYTVRARGGTTLRLGNTADANNNDGWRLTCTDVASWSGMGFTNFTRAFRGHVPNVKVPDSIPSSVTSISQMFQDAAAFNQPIVNWNTSNVTNMDAVFRSAVAFNQPIGSWNTAIATSMTSMFSSAVAFNQPISSWNTANVTSMNSMFLNASAFDQDLSAWQLRRNGVALNSMLWSSGLSVENYSRTLIGWANYVAATNTPATLTLGAFSRKYNTTAYTTGQTYNDAASARAYLVTAAPAGPGWTIVDGGAA